MDDTVSQHFVLFMSPGTFLPESRLVEVHSWDVDRAVELADSIVERHGATPFGFKFVTRSRGPRDLDSRETARSPTHWLGGVIETREEVEARNLPEEETLRFNMRCNDIDRVIINTNSWRGTFPFEEGDVLLDYVPPQKRGAA